MAEEEEEDTDFVRKAVMSFADSSAAGPSSFAPAHLKEALLCGSSLGERACLLALLRLVNKAASGCLPTSLAAYFTGANLTPLVKKDNGVRPVACGELLCRLVEVCVLRKALPDVLPKLSPIQAGVSIRDATTHIALGAAHFLPSVAARKGLGFLQIDLVNAFNSVSRDAILRQVQKLAPSIYPWAKWSLESQGLLFCKGETLLSESGVRQGGPLSPLLFSLALHELLLPLEEELKQLAGPR